MDGWMDGRMNGYGNGMRVQKCNNHNHSPFLIHFSQSHSPRHLSQNPPPPLDFHSPIPEAHPNSSAASPVLQFVAPIPVEPGNSSAIVEHAVGPLSITQEELV